MIRPTLEASRPSPCPAETARLTRRSCRAALVWVATLCPSVHAFAQTATAEPGAAVGQATPLPSTPLPSTEAVAHSREIPAPDLAAGARLAPRVNERTAPPRPEVANTEPSEEHWYGWQTLTSDALSAGLLAGSVTTNIEELGVLGGLGYFFGGPIVHWSHGNVAKGFGSLGLRVAATVLLTAGAAVCFDSSLSGEGLPCGVALVGVLAVPATVAVDAAVFAHDEPPSAEERTSATLIPWVSRERNATGLTWVGRF